MEILLHFGIGMGSIIGVLAALGLLSFIIGIIRASR